MYIDLNNAVVFILVMLRMTGMLAMNPIFGRANIPVMLRLGFAFIVTIMLTLVMPFPNLADPNLTTLIFMAIMELMVGYTAGVILGLFLTIMITGGQVMDMQMGLAMANVFDPNTNMQMALTATVFNAMFILSFFVTNNHLTFILMTAQTFDVIPIGTVGISTRALFYVPHLFSSVLLFATKMTLPMVVVQIIVTMSVGVIMRIVPQINIFVLSIQLKLLVGMLVLVLLVGPLMGFMESLWAIGFERIWEMWQLMAGA